MVKIITLILFPFLSFSQVNKFSGFGSKGCATNNLATYSEAFDNAIWSKPNVTITADATTAPGGTTTADKIIETTASSTHYAAQTISLGNGTYNFSCYAKEDTRNFIWLDLTDNATGDATVFFNLNTGIASAGSAGVGTITSITYGIEAASNGFYRCWVSATLNSAPGNLALLIGVSDNGTSYSYTGGTSKDVYIWGAQLTAGTDLKCYKKTN